MSDFRIKFGMALGPYGTAGPTSSQNVITPGDTTPDVTSQCFLVTANTSATTISYFDVYDAGGTPSTAANGKLITILTRDALTTIQNGGNIFLTTTQGALPANTVIDLVYYNSSWYEKSRSSGDQGSTAQVTDLRRLNLSQAGSVAINVTTANDIVLTSTGADLEVTGFGGGRANQRINILFVITGGQVVGFAQSAGNLALAGTNGFTASGSGVYTFWTPDGSYWRSLPSEIAP